MKQFFCHLFLPHFSNNQRAKLLHHSTILLLILTFFLGQFAVSFLKTDYPAVLGSSIDVSTEELLAITNKDRADQHLPPLVLNSTLSQAASMKADYMFQKDFWAHNGPDGTTPWYFIKKAGYTYTYAGENLARGFTSSSEVVQAWMNSPTHRENMLSSNYKDIGFSIKRGRLLGEDTILVVEMFGSTDMPIAQNPDQTLQKNVLPAAIDSQNSSDLQTIVNGYAIKTTSLISSRIVTFGLGFFILGLFMLVLLVDLLVIERKKIIRVIGHNIDHIFFLGAIFAIMIVVLRGFVL